MRRNDRIMIILGIVIVIIALVGAAVGGSPKITEEDEESAVDFRNWPIRTSPIRHISGSSQENSDEVIVINVTDKYVVRVVVELNWLDEAPERNNLENQPDSFNFTVFTPWEETISSDDVFNPIGNAGQITETIVTPEEGIEDAAIGEWTISIHCGNCGDQVPTINIIGLREVEDTGNDWVLDYYYEFHTNS